MDNNDWQKLLDWWDECVILFYFTTTQLIFILSRVFWDIDLELESKSKNKNKNMQWSACWFKAFKGLCQCNWRQLPSELWWTSCGAYLFVPVNGNGIVWTTSPQNTTPRSQVIISTADINCTKQLVTTFNTFPTLVCQNICDMQTNQKLATFGWHLFSIQKRPSTMPPVATSYFHFWR